MKNLFRISEAILLILSIFFIQSCKKDKPTPPIISTTSVSAITQTTATSGGKITSDGGATITASGVCWSTTSGPTTALSTKTTDGTGTGTFISSLTNLTPITTYYVRAYATNNAGTAYGNEISFTTIVAPSTVPGEPTGVTASAGNAQVTVTFTAPVSNGGSAITGYTVTSNPGNITGTGMASPITVAGLTNGTAYTFTVTATNAIGTGSPSSASNSVTPSAISTTVSDIEGNIYNIVTIGTQTWMTENLKTTKYNDGTSIPSVTGTTEWSNLTTPGYCWYNNDAATYKDIYGALYSWYTVNTGKLCPTGWHVPSKDEWTTLATYLGGEGVAGGKLKETGTSHWLSPNTGANNTSGFTALPGGYRYTAGEFDFVGIDGFWWSANESNTGWAYSRELDNDYPDFFEFNDPKKAGFSVRCLKDN